MSGHKCSNVRYDAERERRSQVLRELTTTVAEIKGIENHIRNLVAQVTPGARDHFSGKVQSAEHWLNGGLAAMATQRWDIGTSTAKLTAALDKARGLATSGRSAQEQIVFVATEAAKLRRQRLDAVARIETDVETRSPMLARWLAADETEHVRTAVALARSDAANDGFAAASHSLALAEGELQAALGRATAREAEETLRNHVRAWTCASREVVARVAAIERQVADASPGLRNTFPTETDAAVEWVAQARAVIDRCGEPGSDPCLATAEAVVSELGTLAERGTEIDQIARLAYGEQAALARGQAEEVVSGCEAALAGNRELLSTWLGNAVTDGLSLLADELRSALTADELRDVANRCPLLASDLRDKIERAEEQEAMHQRRLYVLKGLRQVCGEMGFGEIERPRYEREGDRASRIALAVDTYHRGIVTFYLSLDRIDTDSCIVEDHCFSEFDRLSDQLAEQFGVHTRFEMADGSPRPPDKANDGLYEPEVKNGTHGA